MKKLLILFLFPVLVFAACDQQPPTGPATGDRRFRTTDPSHLYFKNIRSTAYSLQTQPNTRIDLYRLRRFSSTDQRPLLFPVIADNWLQDEAYLLLQPNAFAEGFSDTLRIRWQSRQDSGRYELPRADWPGQYTFAEQIYRSLEQDHQLFIQTAAGRYLPIFDHAEDRQHFRTTLRDYFRLTEKE